MRASPWRAVVPTWSTKAFSASKAGFALPMVFLFISLLVVFVTIMITGSRQQTTTHVLLEHQTRALLGAKTALQLAIYKFRMLPAEFFLIPTIADETTRQEFLDVWMNDLDSAFADSPAEQAWEKLRREFPGEDLPDQSQFNFGVISFEKVSIPDQKNLYTKDYVRIVAWGTYKNQTKTLEEFLEVTLTTD